MTVNLKISGKVQGVFFRRSAKDEADKLDLVGWIRNNADGSVEALAVGPKDKLEKFVEWCKHGPPLAQIESVTVDRSDVDQDFDSFDILQ